MRIAGLMGTVCVVAMLSAGGAVVGAWWLQADAMQKNIERFSAESQTNMLSFRAAAIEKTGFPLQPGLVLSNVQTHMQLGGLQFDSTLPSITIQKELHLQQYHITSAPESQITIATPTKTWNLISKRQGDAKLSLTFATPWNFLLLPESNNWQEWARHLSAVEASSGPQEISTTTNETLQKTGESRIHATYTAGPDVADLTLQLAPMQAEYSPAYDTMMNDIASAMFIQGASQFHSTMAHYSPVTIAFNGRYHGPRFEKWKTSTQPIDITISQGQFNSALGTNDLTLKLQNSSASPAPRGSVDLAIKSTMNAKADQMLAYNLMQMLRDPMMAMMLPDVTTMQEQQLWPIVANIAPRYSTLGPLEYRLQANYSLDQASKHLTVDVAHFDMTSTPYGITLTSKIDTAPENHGNKLETVINCRACPTLFDDISAYADRAQAAIRLLAPNGFPDPKFNAMMQNPWTHYINLARMQLQILAQADATKLDWNYHIIRTHNDQMTLNNQPLPPMVPAMMDGMIASKMQPAVGSAQLAPITAPPAQ